MGNFGGLAHLMVGWYSDLSDGAISPVDGIRKQTVAKLIDVGSVGAFFETLADPRHHRNRKHLLMDVVVIAVCGVIGGCSGPTAIHRWSTLHEKWLRQHLPLANGLPSRDCDSPSAHDAQAGSVSKVFSSLDGGVAGAPPTARASSSRSTARVAAARMTRPKAWAPCTSSAPGPAKKGSRWAKSQPKRNPTKSRQFPLLKQIELSNAIITIDAMGCQREIVQQIAKGKGQYVVAVKDNQPKLLAAVESFFSDAIERDLAEIHYRHCETSDESHGRSDLRSYYLAKVPATFALQKEWPSVKAFGYSLRVTQHADGRETCQVRYYISNRYMSGRRFGEAVGHHWGIESMHWVLDVNFREDDSRTRERTLGDNLSWLRRFAV